MKPWKFGIVLVIFQCFPINAQDLIKNPGFDRYFKYIDSNKNLVYHPENWYYNSNTPNHPIYFCTDRFLNKTLSWNPHPDSLLIKNGQKINYISILVLPATRNASTILREPLEKGKKYNLKFDIKASNQSNCLSDVFVGFKKCLDCPNDTILYKLKFELADSVSNETLFTKWLTVSSDFTAIGREKVLTVFAGSAIDYTNIVYSNQNKYFLTPFSGPLRLKYYVDNFSLTSYESRIDSSLEMHLDSLKVGESIILENIYFEFDKYDLLPESFPVLDEMVNYLITKKNVNIRISGHTDNIGTDEYNLVLSTKRAKAVIDYFIAKGIDNGRLQSIGLGSGFPIGSNESEEGREKNRRIEAKVLAKYKMH